MAAPTTRRRASVTDVAREAGVSVGTVSNVLNRPDVVKPETRTRVEEAIAALSFVPNGVARQLRSRTVTTVGALVLDIRNPYFTEVARGIEDRLGLDDHMLMLASSDDDPERERRYLRLFEEHGVLGMLVVPGSAGTRAVEELHARGARVVLLDHPSSVPGIPSVAVDDRAGGALAAGHLLGRGHERLVLLNGLHSIRQCVDRQLGVRDAVERAGLDPDEALREVTVARMDARGGDEAMRRLVAERDGAAPEAVLCVNDLVAIGVQRALRALGGTALLRSTALVGYDDLDISSELASPLTSVRQPALEMGYRAAAILLEGDAGAEQDVVFQPELVVRDSSTHGG